MERKTMLMSILTAMLMAALIAGCSDVSSNADTDGTGTTDPVALPEGLTDTQNTAADNSVDLLSTIEELVSTDVTTSSTVTYGSATGSVAAVRQGSTTSSAVAAGAPSDGYEKQFDIDFPAGSTGSENDVEGAMTVSTYPDGTWSVDAEDIKFKVKDTEGTASMVGVKYKGTKMNADGEIQEGDISILDALKEIPIDKATLKTLKGIGGFFKKVNAKLDELETSGTASLVPAAGTTPTTMPTETYYVDGEKAAKNPPSAADYDLTDTTEATQYAEDTATYLGELISSMQANVTIETVMDVPEMKSSDELRAAGVEATITTGSTDSMKITKPDASNMKYDQTMIFTINGQITFTESGKSPQTVEFVDVKQTSVSTETIGLGGEPPEMDPNALPQFKVSYTGSIKFNGVELQLNNGKMKYLLMFQQAMQSAGPTGG